MRITLVLPLLAACAGTPMPGPNVPPPPAVFEETSTIGDVVKSRGYKDRDVVEALFAAALERDTALAGLLEAIDAANVQFNDSSAAFREFRANNEAFLASAETHVQALPDSTDRQDWTARLRANRELINERTVAPEALLGARVGVNAELDRLRTLLKLEHALAAMRDYQVNGMPSTTGMEHALDRLKALEGRLRTALAEVKRP